MKLTLKSVEALSYEKQGNAADLRFDDELAGFGVRVYPSGKKAYFVQYRTANGTKRRQVIGYANVLSPTVARGMAKDVLGEVRKGADPLEDRRTKRGEATLKEFFATYEAEFASTKRAWKDDKQRIADHILPALGARKLSSITQSDVVQFRNKLTNTEAKRPVRKRPLKEGEAPPAARNLSVGTVNRIMAVLKHMLSVAEKQGYITKSPAKSVRHYRAAPPRDISLTEQQYGALLEAIDREPNVYAAALIKVALLTGRRIGELRVAKWADLAPNDRYLRVPDTKAGEQQFVTLDSHTAEVLRAVPQIDGNPFIFSGESGEGPLVNYRKAWLRIIKAADVPYFPPHGLRHSAASFMMASGVPVKTIGALLGHKDSRTTDKYLHHQPAQLREAASVISSALTKGRKKEESAGDA